MFCTHKVICSYSATAAGAMSFCYTFQMISSNAFCFYSVMGGGRVSISVIFKRISFNPTAWYSSYLQEKFSLCFFPLTYCLTYPVGQSLETLWLNNVKYTINLLSLKVRMLPSYLQKDFHIISSLLFLFCTLFCFFFLLSFLSLLKDYPFLLEREI